jgi:hypothetical protein
MNSFVRPTKPIPGPECCAASARRYNSPSRPRTSRSAAREPRP